MNYRTHDGYKYAFLFGGIVLPGREKRSMTACMDTVCSYISVDGSSAAHDSCTLGQLGFIICVWVEWIWGFSLDDGNHI